MSDKSHHSRGRHLSRRKRSKDKHYSSPITTQKQVVAETAKLPSTQRESTQTAKLTTSHYPHIATDLLTIGVLAGVIIIILVVLALLL